ncbi:NAD-P-binding protein [Athelia psychrophila]|uniref:NAD-P-binding protein n=1 Tax=Athelia psychrophila TaxID=1759441 RepID=A0A166A450_9AGAM|nr:NAD-P-binding protein [Fibularhizoctonia sp. CBS 109695]
MPSTQKTVLITGCSAGGIGNELALEFHARGLRVIATARRVQAMENLANAGITTLILDVADPESVARAKDDVTKLTGGTLDILVNNAGQPYTCPAIDIKPARAKAIFDVNLWGPIQMVQAFIPLLIAAAASASASGARIVQIGSTAGVVPVPFSAIYNASKAALHSYSDTLRVELAPFNVKVTSIIAGGVQTNIDMHSATSIPAGSRYRPMEDIYQAKAAATRNTVMTDPRAFAKTVVDEALAARPRAWLYAGYMAWAIWLVHTFGGQRAFDGIMSSRFGISGFAAMVKGGKVPLTAPGQDAPKPAGVSA